MISLDCLFFLENIPLEIVVIIIAMIPIGELRLALPLAISAYHFSWWQAFSLSVIGNMIPVYFILKYIGPVSNWLSKKSRLFKRFFDWLFTRTRKKMAKKYEKYGLWALMIFVAIPLPITGAWTGSLAAWLFGLDWKKSIIFVFLGVLIAGVIVTLATTGVLEFLNWIIL